MTSKERVLAAFAGQPVDYVPCSPLFFWAAPTNRLGHRWQFPWGPSDREMVEYCVKELEIDPVVEVRFTHRFDSHGGELFSRYYPAPEVTSKVWIEDNIIHKVFSTPAGDLHAAIRYDQHWPHGLEIPLNSDFNVGHFSEPWLTSAADLECLRHIMLPPQTKEHLDSLRFIYAEAKALADEFHLATTVDIGLGLTGAMQLTGAENLCLMTIDQPDLVDGYLELEHQANIRYMEIAAGLGVDIIRRDGFYETADFYSPAMLEQFLGKRLRKETEVVHQAGKLFGYCVNTGIMPILDYLAGFDFDCLMQIDIDDKGFDLAKVGEKLGGSMNFWIGPSGNTHMWGKDTEVVRQAVRDVFETFGKGGLLITACSTASSIMPWENTLAMIDEWKKLR